VASTSWSVRWLPGANSGTGASEAALDMAYERWRQVLSVDLDGAFLCLQRAARRTVAAGRGGA